MLDKKLFFSYNSGGNENTKELFVMKSIFHHTYNAAQLTNKKHRFSEPIDLTSGTPWKVILKYSLPIMLSYLLQQIYVLTDAVICGQTLSADEIAGVNDTFALTFIFLQFAFGCTAGFGVITANRVGLGDKAGVRRSFASQILLSGTTTLVLTALSLSLLPWLLRIINVTTDNIGVYRAAYSYCFVMFIGIFAQMGYNFICSILRSVGDSVTPLVFLVLSTLLNIGLDLWFLIGFRWGAAGAAFATVLAQALSAVACFVYTFVRYPELRLNKEDFRITKADIASHLRQGLPLGLQFSVLAIGIITMQGAVIRFDLQPDGLMVAGNPAQNGFGAANKLVNFLMVYFNGLGSAVVGYNAQNYGKGDYARIRKGTNQTLIIMLVFSAACTAIGLLLSIGGVYQHIFLSADKISSESIRYGNLYLYADMPLYMILGFLIVMRSAVQGTGRSEFTLGAGIAELVSRVLICSFLPALVNGGPTNALSSSGAFYVLCLGDPGAWTLASLLLLYPYFCYILREKYPN